MPHIRKAYSGDEAGIHESHMRSIREICIHDHGAEEIKGWGYREQGTRWNDAVAKGDVWVVESDSEIKGHACIRRKNEQEAHIYSLYLTPEVLGQGFGKDLLLLMLAKAQNEGVCAVTLDSTLTAHQFYRSFGFVDTASCKTQLIGGYPVRYIPMKYIFT